MNIEVFSTKAFLSFKDDQLDDSDKEHVTLYFKKSNKFKIRKYHINHSLDSEKIRVTLDYPNDYVLLNLIMQIAENQSINGLKLIEWINGEMPWVWEVNNKMKQITPNRSKG
jgi:spore coat polysaccharide biosynthesis protein SpsF